MLDESEIRVKKSTLLKHVEYCNEEISVKTSEIKILKDQISECESNLKVIKEILVD